jgi:hypothetical protein
MAARAERRAAHTRVSCVNDLVAWRLAWSVSWILTDRLMSRHLTNSDHESGCRFGRGNLGISANANCEIRTTVAFVEAGLYGLLVGFCLGALHAWRVIPED